MRILQKKEKKRKLFMDEISFVKQKAEINN
jgi:hypothetical protein